VKLDQFYQELDAIYVFQTNQYKNTMCVNYLIPYPFYITC